MEQLNNVVVTVFLIAVLATAGTDATITGWDVLPVASYSNTVTDVAQINRADTTATVMLQHTAQSGDVVTTATALFTLTSVTYTIEDPTDTFGVITELHAGMTYSNPGDVYLHCSSLDDRTSYSVQIKASDGSATTGTLTLTILVNFSPVITGGRICSCDIATGTLTGETLKDFDVDDRNNGDTATYRVSGGNNYRDWDMVLSTSVLHVRTGITLDRTRYRCYDLTVTATDNGGGPATGSRAAGAELTDEAKLSVYVNDVGTETRCSCSDGAAAVVGSVVLLLVAGIAQLM